MPEVLLPFKDADLVTHDLRAWEAAGSETQVVMIADPTSGTQRNLAIDASGLIGVNALPALPAGAATIGKVDQGVGGASAWATKEVRASTPAQSSVAASASSVTLLSANANRLGATVYNDSTVALYLKLGATASATSFTVKMAAGSYYEVPFHYTGIIDGIWDSATGNARITELAA